MGACLTKVLPQRVRRGRLGKAGQTTQDSAVLTAQGAQVFGPTDLKKNRVLRVVRQVGIARHEALEAYGLDGGEGAAKRCSEVDHVVAKVWGCACWPTATPMEDGSAISKARESKGDFDFIL